MGNDVPGVSTRRLRQEQRSLTARIMSLTSGGRRPSRLMVAPERVNPAPSARDVQGPPAKMAIIRSKRFNFRAFQLIKRHRESAASDPQEPSPGSELRAYDETTTSTDMPAKASVIPTKLPDTGTACRMSRTTATGIRLKPPTL